MIPSLRQFLGWMVSAFRSREGLVLENLAQDEEIKNPGRGVFVHALPQAAGSFIAGLHAEELIRWPAEEWPRGVQILLEAIARASAYGQPA